MTKQKINIVGPIIYGISGEMYISRNVHKSCAISANDGSWQSTAYLKYIVVFVYKYWE